jgi:hypothetical protein
MTCIVGIAENGRVYLGGDSAGIAGLDLTVRDDAKVFRNGNFIFGFTSSFRMCQLLRFSFRPPLPTIGIADYEFMCTAFIDAVRDCLKAGGFATKHNEAENGGSFLVGYRGVIYEIDCDYQVGIPADGFAAVGCGAQIALGSLFSTHSHRMRPLWRLELALKAAERFSAGVRAPFRLLEDE